MVNAGVSVLSHEKISKDLLVEAHPYGKGDEITVSPPLRLEEFHTLRSDLSSVANFSPRIGKAGSHFKAEDIEGRSLGELAIDVAANVMEQRKQNLGAISVWSGGTLPEQFILQRQDA